MPASPFSSSEEEEDSSSAAAAAAAPAGTLGGMVKESFSKESVCDARFNDETVLITPSGILHMPALVGCREALGSHTLQVRGTVRRLQRRACGGVWWCGRTLTLRGSGCWGGEGSAHTAGYQ